MPLRCYILFAMCFVVVPCISAQVTPRDRQFTDSLQILIRQAGTDTAKAILLNKLSEYWSEIDSGKAAGYARRSLELSQGNPYYTALAYFNIAGAYYYFDAAKSKKAYKRTIRLLKGESSRRSLILASRAWYNYSSLFQRDGDDETFLRILLNHAIPLAQKAKDTLRVAIDYSGIAVVFSNMLNYDKAIRYFQKAITLAGALQKPPRNLATFYTRLAKNHLYNEQYTQAKAPLDSARTILDGMTPSFEHANYYMVLGMYYSQTNQWRSAFASLDSAVALSERLTLPYLKTSALFQKYKTYTAAGQHAKAQKTLLRVYHDSLTLSRPGNKLMILYHLAQTEAAMDDMENAYNWLLKYSTLADSLNRKKLKANIAELEIKYQSEKKQRKILALQNQANQQKLILQRKRFINYALAGGLFILLLIIAFIFMLYRNRKRRALQEAQLHEQQLKQIAQEKQLEVTNAMLEGQEQERGRLARDLHDGLGGLLAGMKLKLSDITDRQREYETTGLTDVIHQLDYSVQELRRIAHNMKPETLVRFGVETALGDLCDSLNTPSLRIDFQAIQLAKNLPQVVQIAIYRIIQELLSNAIKHAQASYLLIQCSQNEQRIFITVEDNGQGFEPDHIANKKGIGMANIQKRIAYLDGKLDIDSRPGEGTIVNVEINAYE